MIVRLTAEQIRIIVDRTKEEYPFEACGLLFGDMNEEEAVVGKVLSTRNVLRSSTEFQIDSEEFLRGLLEAEKQNWGHIGFFHSHQAPPEPSVTDVRYMKLWPESVWLIVSSVDHGMAAYQVVNSSVRKGALEVNNQEL